MIQHFFIPFIDTDFICCKCGVVVVNADQMQAFVDHDECIPDYDPRCAETREAIKLHIEELDELELVSLYTPPSFQELQRYNDWLNSADPVKALWDIK